jgi:hypothetical protein
LLLQRQPVQEAAEVALHAWQAGLQSSLQARVLTAATVA